ncbi:MAG: EpsI family protein [Deltaproteobacteria bacterium]|nr:EpsI family protein [Deltaproteobacteria bacterium]MBW2361435.1 EpsI family protein [Deltaproteobacteria bacterium]
MSPRRDEWLTAATCVSMLLVGVLAWGLYLRPELRVDAAALGALPHEVAGWRAKDVPLDVVIESMLEADLHLQRLYVHPLGEMLWLYVGYYGTTSGGRPEHVPRTCYESQGWTLTEQRTLDVDAARGLRTNELLIEKAGKRRLVHFWYRSHRSTGILGGVGVSLDHLMGRAQTGRADGALVRVSTALGSDEGVVTARARLMGFESALDPQLGAHWPSELAQGS